MVIIPKNSLLGKEEWVEVQEDRVMVAMMVKIKTWGLI